MKRYLLFLLLSLSSVSLLAQPTSRITATDLYQIKQLGDVRISPTGKWAVYTVTTTEPIPDKPLEYEYRTHLYLVDVESKTPPKPLTRGAESADQPVWSPDGGQLAFVRRAGEKSQVFILPLDGGEAWQLTAHPYGASSPRWSPDGQYILFSSSVSYGELLKDSLLNPSKKLPPWSLEKPGFTQNQPSTPENVKPNPNGSLAEVRAYLQKDVDDKKAKVINRLNFQGEATTQPELSFGHVYKIKVAERAKPQPITRGFYSYGQASWVPDGSGVIFTTQGDSLLHPDRSLRSRVVRVDTDGSGWTTLLTDPERSFSQPSLSPDGKTLAFVSTLAANTPGTLDQGRLGLLALGSPAAKPILPPFDRSPANLTWSADSRYLYYTAPSNGGFPAYRMDATNRKIDQLLDFNVGVTAFDVSRTGVVYAKTEITNPSELYSADPLFKNEAPLSAHNSPWLEGKVISYPEKRILTNSKGQKVEYWIMKPTQIEAGKKYPLLLQMHGGPTAMWGPGEASMWHEFQFFCARGYGIVYANPRGSGGYGLDFMKANYRDWGKGPAEDVLAAATEAGKEAWADTSRQVITGGSYAGYLTAWIIAHDHRFKAAFAQRGVYELTTFMGEGNAWRLVPNYFGGYPWEAETLASMQANSPQTFVANIRTPLLIKHGENDLRTGVIQSELLYKSLKILGKEVEYVRMPGATHELSRSGNPRQRLDRILRIYEFFERYVGQ